MASSATIHLMTSLRKRNRLNAMRMTQRTALSLFEQRGFDEVTIGELADAVGMAASTIYRHFGTKEGVILWDEHDDDLEVVLLEALRHHRPWEAMRLASIEVLAPRYEEDLDFQLRRVRFIFSTNAMHGAAIEADYQARGELAEAFAFALPKAHKDAADVLAAASLVAIDAALDRWQSSNGSEPLHRLVSESFDRLGHLAAIG